MGKKSKRPKLSIPLSKIEVVIEAATALILLTSIAVLGQNWGLIKYKIPSHYGMGGPDAWTESKMFLVFLLIVIIIFYLGFTILSRFPHIFNYPKPITQENARKIYLLSRTMMTLLKLEIICILFAFEWDMVQKGIGEMGFSGFGFQVLSIALIVIPFITVVGFVFVMVRDSS